MEILRIKGLVKEYKDFVAVDGVDMVVKKGQIYGLLGPNGAGKSTTISIITGLLKATKGELVFEEKEKKINKWKRNIGLVPQDFALYWELTAEENIKFFCSLYGYRGKDLNDRVDRVLEFVGLLDVKKKRADEFSGGMKRRLNIACAIAHSPKLIIMDEPTVGIDPQSRNHILESVKKLRDEGATIIYTSHYMEEVEEICDEISIIDHGKVIASGTKDELKALVSDKKIYKISLEKEITGVKELLEEITGVNKVNVDGREIEAYVLKEASIIDKIIKVLVDNGGSIENLINESPSLETVFLALTGKKLRD